jgi:hypothetical protein
MPTLFLTKLQKTYDGEKTASSTNVLGKVVICLEKTETRSMFITLYSINSKWMKDLNIRPETLKLVQERSGNRYRQGLPQ